MMRSKLMLFLIMMMMSLLVLPGVAEAGWEEGVAAIKAKKYTEAAQHFQAVTEQHPEWPDGFFMLGQALQKLNRKQDALSSYRKAYDLKPGEMRFQLKLGEAYVQSGRYREASELLKGISESRLSAQQKPIYHKLMAVALDKTGQSGDALAALRKAAQASPNDAGAQYNYGAAAFNAGNTDAAVTALSKAVSLDSKDPNKQRAYIDALMRKGRLTRGSGKAAVYVKASSAAKRLVALQPTYDNFLKLGEAQLGASQYTEAVQSFNQAATKKTGQWLPHFYIGQANTATGEYSKAESALRAALDSSPGRKDEVRIWKQLGFVFEKEKKYDEAVSAYNSAGDPASAQRVQENKQIAEHNKEAEQEQRQYDDLKRQEEELKKQLEELGEEKPPGF